MTNYDKEVLTALYKSLDYMMCEDIPCEGVKIAIQQIESK